MRGTARPTARLLAATVLLAAAAGTRADPPPPAPELVAAVEEAAARGNAGGEAAARLSLAAALTVRSRLDEAAEQIAAARALAAEADDAVQTVRADVESARLDIVRADYASAWRELRRAAGAEGFEAASPAFRCQVLALTAVVANDLGLERRALELTDRQRRIARRHDLATWEAEALARSATLAADLAGRGELSRERALATARSAWRSLEQLDDPQRELAELQVRLALGRLAPATEATAHLEAVLRAGAGSVRVDYLASTAMGHALLEAGPAHRDEALGWLERALSRARETGSPRALATALANLGRARLRTGESDEAVDAALEAIDAIEHLAARQGDELAAALTVADYAAAATGLVGALLERDAREPSPKRRELAFAVAERLRARRLLDHLARAGGSARTGSPPGPATLEAVRRELAGDEALLSFVVATPEAGGSWLMVATPAGLEAHGLPGARSLERSVAFWLGLVREAAGAHAAGARRLYDELLAGALAALPPGTRRLVIVPDGVLHRLPFGALRTQDGRSLVHDRELTVAPSAGVWLELRRDAASPAPAARRALLLADPAPPGAGSWPSPLRAAWPQDDAPPGRLPHAGREARNALGRLGGDGDLHLGARAAEARLTAFDAGRYGLVHLAAHAVVDADDPARSALLLAPGGAGHDGLLEAREIAALDLGGAVVTLAACRTASGLNLAGEGVLSLARAFLVGRAGAVVGSLWPLDDRHAAELMDGFYRHLAGGHSVAGALARAQAEQARLGQPAAAWAGLIVVGDGSRVPWPAEQAGLPAAVAGQEGPGRGRPASGGVATLAAGSALTLAALGAAWLARRRG